MIAVSQAFRDAVRLGKPQRAVLKFEDATFTNEDISMTSGGITFYERFNESTDLTVGVAPSSGIRVTMINRDGKLNDFKFGKFTAAIGACVEEKTYTRDDVNGKTLVPVAGKPYKISYESDTVTEWWGNWTKRVYELVKLGTFIAPRPAVIRKYVVTVEADDQMTLFDEMWAKDLPVQYPVTLGGLLSAICSQAGVVLKTPSFLNSDMIVEEQPEDFENATVREVVAWIAEAACGYARFDRDGLLEIVWFNPTTQRYDEHDYTDFTPYSYQVQPVQQLNIRNQNSNAEAILGGGENAYMIQDNPFLRQDDSEETESVASEPVRIMQVSGSASDVPSPIAAESGITPIYNRLAGFAPFNPSSVDLLTDWSVQAGDMVNVASGSDTYSLPVYSMTMNWNGSPKITLESSGNETRDPLPKFERQMFAAGHGGYGNALAVKGLKTWAEITIDEEHALIVEQAGRIDEQGEKIVTVERCIDGINETITDMAGDISDQGELISGAQEKIDGINKDIEDIAGDIDEVTGDLSGVRTDLDGANKKITEQAGLISKQGELIEGVELELNGGEGYIGLKARMDGAESNIRIASDAIEAEVGRATKAEDDLSSRVKITEDNITEQSGKIDEQGKLISGAQEDIDGLNKSITDIAGDIDEVTGDLTGVRTRLDGAEKKITEQAGTIDGQGKLIEGAQTTIDGLNKKIENMATAENIEELKTTVNTVSNTLDAVKGEVETKVSQETFDALGERVGTAETKITQNADAIELRATKKELDEVSASLKVESDKITSVVGDVASINGTLEGWGPWISGIETNVISQRDAIQGVMKDVDTHNTLIYQNRDAIALCATKEGMAAAIKVEADRITSVVGDVSSLSETTDTLATNLAGVGRDLYGYEDEEGVHHGGIQEGLWNAQTEITQTKEAITLKADADTVNALTGRVEKAESQIEINANGITQTVKKGELISQINQSAEEVKISASKINLSGYVTASSLEANYVKIDDLKARIADIVDLTVGDISVQGSITASETSWFNGGIVAAGINVDGIPLEAHYHEFTPNADGTITIGGPTATPGSFNIADTQFYKDGVSAAKTAGAKSVSLDRITTNYVPSFDPNSLTVNVFLTNGEHFSQAVDVTDVYNAGVKSVYVTPDTSHIKWSTGVREIGSINGTVTVVLSNGNEYSREVTSITCPSASYAKVGSSTVTVYYKNVTSGHTNSESVTIR